MPPTTLTFAVEGMHCGSCGLLIDDVLADLPGVIDTRTSVKDGRSMVQVDPARTTSEDVVAAIAEAGYRANPVA
jgi:copper chaperone